MANNKIETRIVSSLEKALMTDEVGVHPVLERQSVLRGETLDFQLIIRDNDLNLFSTRCLLVEVEGLPCEVSCRAVNNVIVDLTTNQRDPTLGTPYYIKSETGCYPDVLEPLDEGKYYRILPGRTMSLWFTCKPQVAGEFSVKIKLTDVSLKMAGLTNPPVPVSEDVLNLTVVDAEIPEQKLIFTQWFHADCLASYYNVPIFSRRHWEIISAYMKCAVENGVNCLLTPVFTPPLDTEIGRERPTVQLVGVKVTGKDKYSFDFALLKKWIRLARKNGVKYIEISHLFSQGGCKYATKVMAEKDGKLCRIFGWDTAGTSEVYAKFLSQFMPALVGFLRDFGVLEDCLFHISDEPSGEHLENYLKAKEILAPHLVGCRVIDALSNIEFYKSGAVDVPVPSTDHIEPFLEENIPQRWAYYCCVVQFAKIGNRFIAYPSSRNRILGVQLYKFNMAGFLHWGFNFYYSLGSRRLINPYLSQAADGQFPSGDPFSVYPAPDGTPLESLRLDVFREALQDISALRLCEELVGRDRVIELIDSLAGAPITFSEYPADADYILKLREAVNLLIEENRSNKK
ncbi:MAG: DUF4091 domain-containing protein [Clostridia bacterium]|nr:DUF4091 domain-containing protein [Oscillospiraceae bacterium]MBQ4064972.1 DUF4091 domain-containing protein [Clostridia bacterium]